MEFYGMTDTGRMRGNNEDSFKMCRLQCGAVLAVVCDGMGGAAGGQRASSTACETFTNVMLNNENVFIDPEGGLKQKTARSAMLTAVNKANTAVYNMSVMNSELAGMGTTLVACLVYKDIVMAVNVGDSRIYAIKDGKATRISKDHSYVQTLVDEGVITEAQAETHPKKNIIMRAVGIDDHVETDFFMAESDMDYILLCSDGLTSYISDSALGDFFKQGTPDSMVAEMVDFANASGGSDNITTVVIDLKGGNA